MPSANKKEIHRATGEEKKRRRRKASLLREQQGENGNKRVKFETCQTKLISPFIIYTLNS